MSEYKYRSPFKRLPVSEAGGNKIKKIQDEYDIFWKRINRIVDKSPEKSTALRKLQESCMWVTRAVALCNINPMECGEIIIDDPLAKEIPVKLEPELFDHQKTISEALARYKEGDRIEIRNKPTIIFKKKR